MTIVQEPGVSALAFVPTPTVRRRRVVVGLAALAAAAGVAAVGTASAAAWSLLGAALALAGGYAALFHRFRRLEVERGFRHLMDLPERAWSLESLADPGVRATDPATAPVAAAGPVPGWRQALVLARFVTAYATGWALSPLVFALTVAVGKTPRDTTGQRWLANLQTTQVQLKEQSRRTLVVSAAATASVTGVAGATVLSGPGVAAAAAPASAPSHPGPLTQVSASSPSAGGKYVVATGDTLSSIAARFGTTYQALAAANHLADPNLIFPGQVLAVHGPAAAAAGSSSRPSGTYAVVAGDSLSSIAARFGTSYQNLAALNGIANPNLIEVGEVLRVSGSAAAAPVSSAHAAPVAATTASAPSGRGQVAAQTARAQVGKPYVWAGAGPNGFDCSGLAMYVWEAAGVQLAHYTVTQYQETERIAESQLQPGDLVFYNTGGGAQPGHVTIYIGGGKIVTADSPGTNVRVEDIDWDGVPMGFGRVV
jgi:cell wall-associated NlpC family hydrolase